MHAIALTRPFTGIQSNADRTIRSAERRIRQADRAKSWFAAVLLSGTLPALLFIGRDLGSLIDLLNSPEADNCTEADLRRLTHDLSQMNGRLNKILKTYSAVGVSGKPIYRTLLDRIANRNNHLASIVEGLYMSTQPGFGEIMNHSARDLEDALREPGRRALVGKV
jgi:hypothetical protein